MTTTYDPEDRAERRRVLQNDARVRDQSRNGDSGTYLSHTHSDVGGRFAVTEHQTGGRLFGDQGFGH
jgi:hypothetical protein